MSFKIWKSLNPREQKSKSQYSHDFLFFEYKLDKMQGANWGLILRSGRKKKKKKKKKMKKKKKKKEEQEDEALYDPSCI